MTESADASKPAVLHINLARGWRGGEQQTWLLMKELASAGHRQGLCAHPDSPLAGAVKALNDVTILPPGRCLRWPWGVGKWSLVHAHEGRGVYLAWWLKKTGRLPYVITRRMQHPPKPRPLTKAAYRDADALVGISSAACHALESFTSSCNVQLIPSVCSGEGASPSATVEIRQRYEKGADPILIGHAGALVDSEKRQSVLIEACEYLRRNGLNVICLLFGEGPDRPMLERMAEGCDWIHLPGHVENIQDHLASLDVFAFPSRHEGLGSVLLEAFAVGCPVVASDVGGIPDIIHNEETGLLVPPDDAVRLAEALSSLIENQEKRDRISKNAISSIKSNFSPQKMHLSYHKLYLSISNTVTEPCNTTAG